MIRKSTTFEVKERIPMVGSPQVSDPKVGIKSVRFHE